MENKIETSPRWKIDKAGLQKVGVGALIAIGGVILTYWQEAFTLIDFGQWQPIAVAVNSVLINIARKLLTDYSQG